MRGISGWTLAGIAGLVAVILCVPVVRAYFSAGVNEAGRTIKEVMPTSIKQGALDEQRRALVVEEKANLTSVAMAKQQYELAEESAQKAEDDLGRSRKLGQQLVADLSQKGQDKFVYGDIGREYTRDEANDLLGRLTKETERLAARTGQLRALANARKTSLDAAQKKLEAFRDAAHKADLDRIAAETGLIEAETLEAATIQLQDSALGRYQQEVQALKADSDARKEVIQAQQPVEALITSTGRPVPVDNLEKARQVFGVKTEAGAN